MSRFLGIVSILAVVILAMAFAAANAGNRVTLELGIMTLFRVPVTLVAFSGLLTGMLVMFATGVYSDLKVRRILRERLAQEAQAEQRWIDGNQQDLFATPLEDEVQEGDDDDDEEEEEEDLYPEDEGQDEEGAMDEVGPVAGDSEGAAELAVEEVAPPPTLQEHPQDPVQDHARELTEDSEEEPKE
jgi:uncharacterized integral membrane protein